MRSARQYGGGVLRIYVTILGMKKWIWMMFCLIGLGAWAAEPLMLLNPGRETFLNFPSAVFPDKTITIFLPEPAVPLHGKYPVVYVIGAIPKDAPAVQDLLARAAKKAIIVGVNLTEADLKKQGDVSTFFSRELVPYIDTNYPTLQEPVFRAIAASGPTGTRALAALLARKQLFARAFVLNSGTAPISFAGADGKLRVLAVGAREELAVLWQTLQDMGRKYGTQAVLQIAPETTWAESLNLDYLFADDADLQIVKLEGNTSSKNAFIARNSSVSFSVKALLANKMEFDYIPLNLRISPPYLSWDAALGVLKPIPGATAGKVKIGVTVDNLGYTAKIRLKK